MQRFDAVSGHPGRSPSDFLPGFLPGCRASFKSKASVPAAVAAVDSPFGSFGFSTKVLANDRGDFQTCAQRSHDRARHSF